MVTLAENSTWEDLAELLSAGRFLGHRHAGNGRNGFKSMTKESWSRLPDELAELFALLTAHHVDYVLVGGVALLKYIEGRNTQDIDLVVSPAALRDLPEIQIASRDQDFARGNFKNVQVDLLLTTNPVFKLVLERYVTVQFFGEFSVACVTAEGLLLLKLYALPSLYRQRDMQRVALYEADITMLMDRMNPDIEPIFNSLSAHLDEGAMNELRRIVADIKQKISRVRKPSAGTPGLGPGH